MNKLLLEGVFRILESRHGTLKEAPSLSPPVFLLSHCTFLPTLARALLHRNRSQDYLFSALGLGLRFQGCWGRSDKS